MSDPLVNAGFNPKISEELINSKLADLAAASATKTAQLDIDYENALRLRAAGGKPEQAGIVRTAGDVAIKLGQGAVDLGQSVVGLGSLATGGLIGKGARAIGYDPEETNRILGQYLSDAQKASDAKVQNADGFVDTVKTSLENPRSILGSVTESLPAMLAGMGVSGAIARSIALEAAAGVEGGLASVAGRKAAQDAVEAAGFKLSAIGAGVEGAQTSGQIADQAQAAGRDYGDYVAPALAAGAITGAVGMVSNKVFGDAGTDLATGSKTLTGSKLAKIGKEAFSEGVTEELPQSAQEQYFTNIAMGEPDTMKGVANAAGSGLVAGAAMGAGMASLHSSHREAKQADQSRTADTLAKVREATATGDITPFIDPKSGDYDLSRAVGVLTAHSMRPDTAPEVRQENMKKAGDLLSQLEEQHAQATEKVDNLSSDEVKSYKEKLAAVEAQIKAADPKDTAAMEKLTDFKEAYTEHLADIDDPKAAEAARNDVSKLERQLTQARTFMGALQNTNEPAATSEEVTSLVDQVRGKAPATDGVDSAQRIINLSMTQPGALTSNQALNLANDKSANLTEPQRAHLRVFSEARIAENIVSTQSKVSQEVLYGSKNNVGIAEYRNRIANAIASGSEKTADRQLGQLNTFATGHEDKASTARDALDEFGLGSVIMKTDGGWQSHPPGVYTPAQVRKNGGLTLNSEKLVKEISNEAVALRAAHTEMNSATQIKFGRVQSESSTQQTVPAGNINTPENEEDTARPAVPAEPVGEVPASPAAPAPKKTVMQTADEHLQYLLNPPETHTTDDTVKIVDWSEKQFRRVSDAILSQDPADADRMNELQDTRNALRQVIKEGRRQVKADAAIEASTTQAAEPAKEKAKRTVQSGAELHAKQDALVREAAAKAEQRKAEKAAKAATVEQPAAVSEANPAPVAETVTPEAEVVNKESTAPSPSSEPASPAVADAPAAPVPTSAPVAGTLSVFNEAHDDKAPYMERNLIGAHFAQRAGDETGARPLAKVVDFLTGLKAKAVKVSDFVQQKTDFDDPQRLVVAKFIKQAALWNTTIEANLKKGNAGYGFEDMIQFLLKDTDGKLDLDENVKTAISYAAYSWVAENATRPAENTNEEINLILGRGEDALVSNAERNALAYVGTRQNVVINALGQRAVAALGLKSLASAPVNLQADLESSIGAHVMKLLLDEGVLERTILTGDEMKSLTKSDGTAMNAQFQFVKLGRTQDGLNEKAEAIFQSNKGTQGILDKLFGVEAGLKEPSLAPDTTEQKTTRNTNQGVPSELHDQMTKDDAEANYIRTDMYNLAGQISPETLATLAGAEESGKAVHITRRMSTDAKNNGLMREISRIMDWTGKMGTDVALYLKHTAWMQQRVGIETNLINPQTSKVHRNMMTRSGWESKIDMNNVDEMNNFKLRVAEGLGVKTDKKNMEKALADYAKLAGSPEIKGAVAVLVKSLNGPEGGKLSDNDQAILIAGVAKGGENMHSLSSLMALAQAADAYKKAGNKPTTFTSQLMAEVDGVTNGPMFSQLLLGAANSVKEMYSLLNRGGFFEIGNAHTEYNNWRDAPGNFDLYENTALHMTQAINAAGLDGAMMDSIYAFTGALEQDGVVQKAGRNIIKTPLTAMVFGSSVNNAVDSMADNFIESIYDAIQDNANGVEKAMPREAIVAHLRELGVNVPAGRDMMEMELSPSEIKQVKTLFKETIGAAVKTTMEADFAVFIEARAEFNKTAQINFELYNAVYAGVREQMINELVASGNIALSPTRISKKTGKTVGGKPLHDLTNAQMAELKKRVASVLPVMHSPMSKESKQLKAGLLVAKSERKLSTNEIYNNEIKFGQSFVKADGTPEVGANGKPIMSTSAHGYEVTPTGPGVAMVPVSMHSADSAVSVRANPDGKALNIHDAHGHGVNSIVEQARNLNKATWDTMLNYSPAGETRDSFLRTVSGLASMIEAGNLPDQVLANLAQAMVDFGEKHETNPLSALSVQAHQAVATAYRADMMKFDTMQVMNAVNQYAMEGGAYEVTDKDRAKIDGLRAAVPASLTVEQTAQLDTIETKVADLIKAEVAKREKTKAPAKADPEMDKSKSAKQTSNVAELGKSNIKSDPALVKALTAKPQMSFQEAVNLLKGLVKGDFQSKLLGQLERSLAGKVSPMINYVTKGTDVSSLLAPGGNTARGWYVAMGDNTQINLLSPDFKYSGLTVELMLHEMTHAVLAQTIDAAQRTGQGPAFELVNELETLRDKAAALVKENGLEKEFGAAVADVQELVTWGMTNTEFQDRVLRSVMMESTTGKNKLMDGMKRFAQSLVKMIFGRTHDGMSDGITVLIHNVSGLFNAAAKNTATNSLVLNQASPASSIRDLTTANIYDALAQNNNGNTVSTEHDTHLKGLLSSMVSAIYGPFGSFKAEMMKQTAQDPMDVYTEALATGEAPFASETLAAGFSFTNQEAFVLEQVEATMRSALSSKDGTITIAYKELTKLYLEVRAKLTVESFHPGDWSTASASEQAEAKALYDFVFTIKNDATGKSDYMSRFAALALTHEGFRKLMQFDTAASAPARNESFNERLNRIFNTLISWVAGRMTSTFRGQRADHKLTGLVQQLIQIEAKRKASMGTASKVVNAVQDSTDTISDVVRDKIVAFAQLPFFKTNGSQAVQLIGNMAQVLAGDRVDSMMEAYQKLRDQMLTGQLGVAAAMVNEIRGATDSNAVYHYLLRATKHLEGQRKDIATNISNAVMKSFANEGEDLTKEQKTALSQMVLRGDMQSLLGDPAKGMYSVDQLHDMLKDPKALQREIDTHEAQLTGQMSRFYQVAAEHLGHFLAKNKVTVAHMLFNAGNIAAVSGTGMESHVTEAQAAAATPIIDRLASLYALKYADGKQLRDLRDVFAAEAARTDGGHGVEMIMKTHRVLQKESADKLFQDSAPLQMKGYLPEVYDPYMSVVMANEEEGKALELRGYKAMPGQLAQDSADSFSEPKRIYSLRDGGMKQWNSGIVSTTDTRAKGSKVLGHAQSASAAGQLSQSNMNKIRAGKRAAIQAMFNGTAPKPNVAASNHMAPVMNADGDVANYRYMMSTQVKDNLLNRDNRPERLLGSMGGQTFDKQASKAQNSMALKAMHAQYRADFAENPRSYLLVGPQSSDPQLRELWSMMPKAMREEAKSLFGKDGIYVRNDVLDINFGYRKLSIGQVFDKEEAQRSFVETMFVDVMQYAFKEKAQLRTRQFEDIWQAIVKETKANLVVKSFSTMSGNLRSNFSQLFLMGVPFTDIVKGHRVAFKAAWEYKQDTAKLFSLTHQLEIGHLEPGQTKAKVEYEVKRLQDNLARNPIRPLIDAGLMPTIVEDVNVDEDIYSYKSRFDKTVDDFVDGVNPHILKAGQYLTMHHSTAPYKVMSYFTQVSDFLARYTLYQHDISKKDALTHDQAVQRASEAFINYDVPTHRKIQYANDSGLIMFSKYYVRIQKVLGRIYKDAPGRVLALMAAEHMIGDQPTVMDSGFVHHIGNPFNAGAFSYLGSLDSVSTVSLIAAPFTTATWSGQ